MQKGWARENGLRFSAAPLPWRRHRWIYETLAAQLRVIRPDVLYVQDMHLIHTEFLQSIRDEVPLIVGQNGTRMPAGDFSVYDLVVSSLPNVVEQFCRTGCRAEFLALGFEPAILDVLGEVGPVRYDVTHIGGYTPVHRQRTELLEAVCRAGVNIFFWGYDEQRLAADSPIRPQFRGRAWGLTMYRIRARSRIVLTRHIDAVAGRHANLASMYEATGVGSMLLVDAQDDLPSLFEPGREVVTYRDTDECIEQIRYYLTHEDERLAVAKAGQRRTLRDHTWRERMRRLCELLESIPANPKKTRFSEDGPELQSHLPSPGRKRGEKPRVGMIITAGRSGGGYYQYAVELLRALVGADAGFEAVLLDYSMSPDVFAHSKQLGVEVVNCGGLLKRDGVVRRAWHGLRRTMPGLAGRIRSTPATVNALRNRFRRIADEHGLELLVLGEPSPLGFETGLPFIMPVHDLQHRLQPEFPEVSADGEYQKREYLYANAARQAVRLLVDSPVGREDLVQAYDIPPERAAVLPFVASFSAREVPSEAQVRAVRRKYELPNRYVFYPAQFWTHKNHKRLAKALHLLHTERQTDVPLVLVGGKQNAYDEFVETVKLLGIENLVHILGYVPDDEIASLYVGSEGLVMPTFFGPTNLPILEAWCLGVPVITSDIRGVREQAGDAALLADPRDERALAEAVHRLWSDPDLRTALAKKGAARAAEFTPQQFAERAVSIVESALEEVLARRSRRPVMETC
jgi:glycosyltransferase involved in cell wall biosynthesis